MKILITGDFCPIGRVDSFLTKEKYSELFNNYTSIFKSVDLSIVNLECPITISNKKFVKSGPCLKSENLNSFNALKYINVDLLTLANNHIKDYSSQGVLDTIQHATNHGFSTVGAGKNLKDSEKPFIKVIQGVRIGVINVAENEFCSAEKDSPGAYTFDFINNTNLIQNLTKQVDKIILIYHGGREHYHLPTPEQRKRLRYFTTIGVDAVVTHHSHCISGYEIYNEKPIIYGLGNFVFDYKKKYQKGKWTEGMSVVLTLQSKEDNFSVEFIPHLQGREEDCSLVVLKGVEKENFLNKINKFSDIIMNDEKFYNEWSSYLEGQRRYYLSSLLIKNYFIRALFILGILPQFLLRRKSNTLLLNLIRCETHLEISRNILEYERENL